jgi:hypothetical protein
LAKTIRMLGREPVVVAEPYEFPEAEPHCHGTNLLWFGHSSNFGSLIRLMPSLVKWPVRILTNKEGVLVEGPIEVIDWDPIAMVAELTRADIVLMPATAAYKSPNRTVEAIRQGCFVVAEPHPSLMKIPGIWIGNIQEGIEWASQHQQEANERTRLAQQYVNQVHHPRTVACAWSRIIQACPSTWGVDAVTGPAGSISTANIPAPTCATT